MLINARIANNLQRGMANIADVVKVLVGGTRRTITESSLTCLASYQGFTRPFYATAVHQGPAGERRTVPSGWGVLALGFKPLAGVPAKRPHDPALWWTSPTRSIQHST